FGERIQVNRRLLSENDVVRLVAEMRPFLAREWGVSNEGDRAHLDTAAGPERGLQSAAAPDLKDGLRTSRGHIESRGLLRTEVRAPVAVSRCASTDHPTFFEVVTVMALRYFAEQKCDLVIWETGLGGRLDATNIVTPLASVITNIQYD